jgi:hypothetical protein
MSGRKILKWFMDSYVVRYRNTLIWLATVSLVLVTKLNIYNKKKFAAQFNTRLYGTQFSLSRWLILKTILET